MDTIPDLELFIDTYYNHQQQNMNSHSDTPSSKRKKADSSTDTDDLKTLEIDISLLASINKKLDLLPTMHNDIQELRRSIDFAHDRIQTLEQFNTQLQTTVEALTREMDLVKQQNKLFKETLLDLQTRSMRDNLIFAGLHENKQENAEDVIKDFLKTHLKLPPDTVKTITFHRAHRIGQQTNKGPRPIVVKFEHFKDKELIKSRGKELKGTVFGLNDQFPKEIQERRKILYPILKDSRKNNKRAHLVVDKLYIEGQLYRNSTTPWLL